MTEDSVDQKTVEQFAKSLDKPVDLLMDQLKKAGVTVSDPQHKLTTDEKMALYTFLKGEVPTKIAFKRQRVSELKDQGGRKVQIVRQRRHVYGKRDLTAEPTEILKEETPESLAAATALKTGENLTATSMSAEEKETGVNAAASLPGEEKKAEGKAVAGATAATKVERKTEEKSTSLKTKTKGRERFKEEEIAKVHKPKVRAEDDRNWRQIKQLRSTDVASLAPEIVEGEEATEVERQARRVRHKPKVSKETSLHPREIANRHAFEKPTAPVMREVLIPQFITVAELAQAMSVKVAEVIKALMQLDIMATINHPIDQDTAVLVVESMKHIPKVVKTQTDEETLWTEETGERIARAPVVTVMGHVDHGKTTLLDYIRRSRVAAKEAGGITQHIGAYHVKTDRGEITFLDTPGHAAFTAMRARGVKATDIVVLVVAADDGVMPQTIEAIQHGQAAEVPIVVAINKVDKPEADLNRIQGELAQHGLVSEAWGGQVICVSVSAKEGTGVDKLLEAILLQAEMMELRAPVTGAAKGIVLEARLDKGRGPIASVLVQSGILKHGDMLIAGSAYGRVRALTNELGERVTEAGPSIPVEVLGLTDTPHAGDTFVVVQDERKAREVALKRQGQNRDVRRLHNQPTTLEGFFDKIQQGEMKQLRILLKADVTGSAEALGDALTKLSNDKVKVMIITQGVGGINESDITLAMASQAVVIGFNVRAEAQARKLAEKEGVVINYYSVIYDVVDGIKRAINGLLGPEFKENILGLAEVRDVFRSAKFGAIAGCMVIEGIIKRGCPVRVLRNNVVIYQGELDSLRRFKDDVNEVRNGMECGLGVKNYNDIKPGDQIEVYETVEVARSI